MDSTENTDNTDNKFAVLQEFNDSECECWLYFIKFNENEKALQFLSKQLESIEWSLVEEQSTFDLDLEHLVSEQTAKEMTKVELNHYQWHRKFDGKLDMINFKFKKNEDNEDRMFKVNDKLIYGQIENFIDQEDIDPEDLTDCESEEEDGEEKNNDKKDEDKGEEKMSENFDDIIKNILSEV